MFVIITVPRLQTPTNNTILVRELDVRATGCDETNLQFGCPACGFGSGGGPPRENSVPTAGMGSGPKQQQS